MFYEISTKELAKYIGNTSFDLVANKATSDAGERIDNFDGKYACKVNDVDISAKNIKVDTFLDVKGDITCIIHIPPTKFTIITEELSEFYPNKDKLSFSGKTNPCDKEFTLWNSDPRSMEDFKTTLEIVVAVAERYITEEIEAHRHHEKWKVCCDNVTVNYDKIFHNER